jgi:hypothetical protein
MKRYKYAYVDAEHRIVTLSDDLDYHPLYSKTTLITNYVLNKARTRISGERLLFDFNMRGEFEVEEVEERSTYEARSFPWSKPVRRVKMGWVQLKRREKFSFDDGHLAIMVRGGDA